MRISYIALPGMHDDLCLLNSGRCGGMMLKTGKGN